MRECVQIFKHERAPITRPSMRHSFPLISHARPQTSAGHRGGQQPRSRTTHRPAERLCPTGKHPPTAKPPWRRPRPAHYASPCCCERDQVLLHGKALRHAPCTWKSQGSENLLHSFKSCNFGVQGAWHRASFIAIRRRQFKQPDVCRWHPAPSATRSVSRCSWAWR
jgi:hypothetical protein